MSVTGDADGPSYRLGVAISDIVAGMFAAHGVLAALYAREKTGDGTNRRYRNARCHRRAPHVSGGQLLHDRRNTGRLGNRHPTIVPYEVFDTSDGQIVIAVGNDDMWRRLCAAAELTSLGANERLATNRGRVEHYDEVKRVLGAGVQDADAGTMAAHSAWCRRTLRLGS